MALDLGREREQIGIELEQVIGREQPRDDRRRRSRPRPPLSGISERLGTRSRRRAAAARTRARSGCERSRADVQVGDDRERPGLHHLELEPADRARRPARRTRDRGSRSDAGTRTTAARASSAAPAALDRAELGLAGIDAADLLERGLGILEPVTGQHARDPLGAAGAVRDQPGDRAAERRLAEDALVARKQRVGREDLLVGDGA